MRFLIRVFNVQTIVLIISLVLIYAFLYTIRSRGNLSIPEIYTVLLYFVFEFVFIPINTLLLAVLKFTKIKKVKIETNKSIAIFSFLFELIAICDVFIFGYHIESIWVMIIIDYLIICVGLVVLNLMFFVKAMIH